MQHLPTSHVTRIIPNPKGVQNETTKKPKKVLQMLTVPFSAQRVLSYDMPDKKKRKTHRKKQTKLTKLWSLHIKKTKLRRQRVNFICKVCNKGWNTNHSSCKLNKL